MRLALTLLALAALLTTASAEDYMSLKWNASTKEIISDLSVGDVNGDGKLEVAASGSADGIAYLFDEYGTEVWSRYVLSYINTVKVMDTDGDKKDEVVTGHADLSVFTADGERTMKFSTPTGMNIYKIVPADITGDGVEEIIFTTYDKKECSRNKPSTIYAVDGRTHELIWRYSVDTSIPESIIAADTDGDGRDEIIVGLIQRSVGYNKVCAESYSKASYILAIDDTGTLLWQFETIGAVFALAKGDIDGDGQVDIAAGSYPTAYAIKKDGTELWENVKDINTYVEDIIVADLDGDNKSEVIAASSEVHFFDQNGTLKFNGLTNSRVYSLAAADVDADGKPEIIAGSGSVYVFSKDGTQLWRSPPKTSYHLVAGADIDGNGYAEVIAASAKDIYVFQTQEYAKKVRADTLYNSALARVQKDPGFAIEELTEAKRLYSELGQIDMVSDCLNQINKLKGKTEQLSGLALEAAQALETSTRLLSEGEYINSSRYANIARSKFSSLNDEQNKDECDRIIEELKFIMSSNASTELLMANESYHAKEYEKALEHAQKAEQYYSFIGDFERAEKAGILTKNLRDVLGIKTPDAENNQTNQNFLGIDFSGINISGLNMSNIDVEQLKGVVSSLNPLHLVILVFFAATIVMIVLVVYFSMIVSKNKKPKAKTLKAEQLHRTTYKDEKTTEVSYTQPTGVKRRVANVVRYQTKDEGITHHAGEQIHATKEHIFTERLFDDEDVKYPKLDQDLRVELPPNKGIFRVKNCRKGICITRKKNS